MFYKCKKKNIENSITHKIYQKISQEDYTIGTISDLCSFFCISKKTVYKQFASKDEFLLILLTYLNAESANELEKIIGNEKEFITQIIQIFTMLISKTNKKNKIQESYGKQNQEIDFLNEIFRMIFTNIISKLLEKMNNKSALNIGINFFLFAEVVVKFIIETLNNKFHKNNSVQIDLFIKYILINSLKGICTISEHKKIDGYVLNYETILFQEL